MKNSQMDILSSCNTSHGAQAGGLRCFAVVVPGLESVAADELEALAVHDEQAAPGGVCFSGSMDALCRVNLRARTITRVLLRLASFKALSFPELYNKAKKIDWARYIPEGRGITVRASCHHSKLMHSGRVEQAVQDAVRDRLQDSGVSMADGAEQLVTVRLEHDVCSISIDASGDRLDRRGYRKLSGHAPIRETMAAGILAWMDWQADETLLAPMCGSGTFAIEAALMGKGRAVNPEHDFALLHWPCLNAKRWKRVHDKAIAMRKDVGLTIEASDTDADVLEQAKANAEAAGISDAIRFTRMDVRKLEPVGQGGLIIVNPPYGERIKGDTSSLYRELGKLFRSFPRSWRMAVIVPDQISEKALGMPVVRRLKLKHGGLWVHVLHVEGRGHG